MIGFLRVHPVPLLYFFCAMMLLSIFGGCNKMQVKHFNNGYYAIIYTHSDETERWALHLKRDDRSRLITEAIIIDNRIVSLMPTVEKWQIVGNWGTFPTYPSVGVSTIHLNTNGDWNIQRIATDPERQETIRRIGEFGGGVIYITVEIPVELDSLEILLDAATPAASSGMGIFPIIQGTSAGVGGIQKAPIKTGPVGVRPRK